MTLTANEQGEISGQFTVPENVPTGTKLVQFIGDQGNYGETTYTSRGLDYEKTVTWMASFHLGKSYQSFLYACEMMRLIIIY